MIIKPRVVTISALLVLNLTLVRQVWDTEDQYLWPTRQPQKYFNLQPDQKILRLCIQHLFCIIQNCGLSPTNWRSELMYLKESSRENAQKSQEKIKSPQRILWKNINQALGYYNQSKMPSISRTYSASKSRNTCKRILEGIPYSSSYCSELGPTAICQGCTYVQDLWRKCTHLSRSLEPVWHSPGLKSSEPA